MHRIAMLAWIALLPWILFSFPAHADEMVIDRDGTIPWWVFVGGAGAVGAGATIGDFTFEDGYLNDPEEEPNYWDEPVDMTSPETAEEECRVRAQEYGVGYNGIEEPPVVQKGTLQTYRCKFRG